MCEMASRGRIAKEWDHEPDFTSACSPTAEKGASNRTASAIGSQRKLTNSGKKKSWKAVSSMLKRLSEQNKENGPSAWMR